MKKLIFTKLHPRFAYVGQFAIENLLPGLKGQNVGSNLTDIDLSGVSTLELPAGTTLGGASLTALGTITSTSATAFAVGRQGVTNPVLNVNANAATVVTGITLVGAASGAGMAIQETSSATNESLTLDAKGTGTVTINGAATNSGLVTLGNSTSLAGAAVNGPLLVTSASATSLQLGPNGATNPVLLIDSSTASQAAGLKLTGATAAGNVALQVISSGSATPLFIDAKGAAVITLAGVAAGALGVNVGTSTSAAGTVLNVTSTNANALTVGRQGATNPVLTVNANTASVVSGLSITGAGTGVAVALLATDSGSNTGITLDGKGTGTIGINTVSATSGLVTIGNTTSLAGLAVNGPILGSLKVQASTGATQALTAAQSGSTFLFDRATGVVYTLPVPVVGMYYDFVCSVTITSGAAEVDTSSGSVFILGSVQNLKTDGTQLGCFGNGTSTVKISSNGSTTGGLKGGQFRMTAISSTIWQITGNVLGSGAIATPFA